MSSTSHQSVLFEESLEALQINPEGIYIDGTFGRGGHSKAILARLNAQGRLYAFDKDPEAIEYSKQQFQADDRFQIVQSSFVNLQQQANTWGIVNKVNGILLDLGVSSPQLDDPKRGFSFLRDGPLDMRMDPASGESAASWLAHAEEKDIASVLKEYGEERFAKRIAKAIIFAREQSPIGTTKQLADIVAKAHPAWEKHKHPATRTFQAIRIYINQELTDLSNVLLQALDIMAPLGRLVVISFHSLEDRIVKQFIQRQVKGDDYPLDLPIQSNELNQRMRKVGKLITPGKKEISENPRARSAKLRVAEKIV